MNYKDLLLLFMVDADRTKTSITKLCQMFEKDYYQMFENQLPKLELPRWMSGDYGLYSPDINMHLEQLVSFGLLFKTDKQGKNGVYYLYALTPRGKKHLKEIVIPKLGQLQKIALEQITEMLQ